MNNETGFNNKQVDNPDSPPPLRIILIILGVVAGVLVIGYTLWALIPYGKLVLVVAIFAFIMWALFFKKPLIKVEKMLGDLSSEETVPDVIATYKKTSQSLLEKLPLTLLITHVYHFVGNPEFAGKGIESIFSLQGNGADKARVIAFKMDTRGIGINPHFVIHLVRIIRGWGLEHTFSSREMRILNPLGQKLDDIIFGKKFTPTLQQVNENKLAINEYKTFGSVQYMKYYLANESPNGEFRYKCIWGYKNWLFEVSSDNEKMVSTMTSELVNHHNLLAGKR